MWLIFPAFAPPNPNARKLEVGSSFKLLEDS